MSDRDAARLNRKLERLAAMLPAVVGSPLRWLRNGAARWVRIPIALMLMVGGVLGFLPILGFWMLPLGVLLLALDVPALQRPMLHLCVWTERRWLRWKRRRQQRAG